MFCKGGFIPDLRGEGVIVLSNTLERVIYMVLKEKNLG